MLANNTGNYPPPLQFLPVPPVNIKVAPTTDDEDESAPSAAAAAATTTMQGGERGRERERERHSIHNQGLPYQTAPPLGTLEATG